MAWQAFNVADRPIWQMNAVRLAQRNLEKLLNQSSGKQVLMIGMSCQAQGAAINDVVANFSRRQIARLGK